MGQDILEAPQTTTVKPGELAVFTCKASTMVADIAFVVHRIEKNNWASYGIFQSQLILHPSYKMLNLTVPGTDYNNGLLVECSIVMPVTYWIVNKPQPPAQLIIEGLCW